MQNEEEIPRSIRFSRSLWEALDKDARRCRRSAQKQLEALLIVYYELEEIEIDKGAIARTKERVSEESSISETHANRRPHVRATAQESKRKDKKSA